MKEYIMKVNDNGIVTSVVCEVVRCKDCKHGGCRTQNTDGSIFRVVCKKHSTKRNERWMDADWFCADGEVNHDA